jgi:hypothetical protein
MEYESHIFIKSLYEEGQKGSLPINPAHYSGRFALKSAYFASCIMFFHLTWTHSNMLIISFGMRTGSSTDPLVEKALVLAMEFMDLTGQYLTIKFPLPDG